jgi:hypothetical protein
MKRLIPIFTLVALAMAVVGVAQAQSDPFVGTWNINVAKSKYNPGPLPKSQSRTWDASGKVDVTGTDAAGNPIGYGYIAKYDGKKHPTSGNVPSGGDTVVTKRVDKNTVEAVFTKNGKQVELARFVLAKDGKSFTLTAKGTNTKGVAYDNMAVWEKQ